MKFQQVFILFALLLIGTAIWKYVRHHKSQPVGMQELGIQLETSTPELNSTMSLRTVLGKIAATTNGLFTADNRQPIDASFSDVSSSQTIYGGVRDDIKAISARRFTHYESEMAKKYFAEIIKSPSTAKLYERSKEYFGTNEQGDGAARWVTLGGIFESSPRYGNTLEIALQEANRNADSIMDAIHKSIEPIRRDPFIYQMTMNLVYKLDTAPARQAEFYGQEFEAQLKGLSGGKPTDSFWVSTLGLLLAQQAGVRGEDLVPYFKRGLEGSKGSPHVLAEFKQSAMFYFPGLSL
jgi:hypothetical protein